MDGEKAEVEEPLEVCDVRCGVALKSDVPALRWCVTFGAM